MGKIDYRKFFWQYLKLSMIAFLLAIAINSIIGINIVSGSSMEPTIKNNSILFGDKIAKHLGKIQRFDIITAKVDDRIVIKRVIGIPNDKITIKDNNIYINDVILNENIDNRYHIQNNDGTINNQIIAHLEIVLSNDEYFVMGDNRNFSRDSRIFGPINKHEIKSKIILIN